MKMSNSIPKEILNFKGMGNPKESVWFMGIEEGGGPEDLGKEEFVRKYSPEVQCLKKNIAGKKVRTPTWDFMSKIMIQLLPQEDLITIFNKENLNFSEHNYEENWRKFRDLFLGKKEQKIGGTFLLDFYPLPCKKLRSDSFDEYKKLDYFSFNNKSEYKNYVKQERLRIIKEFYYEKNPHLVVCYGKTYWNEFKDLFEGINEKILSSVKSS